MLPIWRKLLRYIWDEGDREEGDENHGENEDVEDGDEVNDIEVNFHKVFQGQYRRPCTTHTLQLLVHDCFEASSI